MVIVVSFLCNYRESKVKIENTATEEHSQMLLMGFFESFKKCAIMVVIFSLCHSGFALVIFFHLYSVALQSIEILW